MKGKGSSGERTQRDEIIAFAREQYGAEPEYPWEKLPLYCVLRHRENRKWYALIMDIPGERIDPRRKGERADILNLRVDPEEGSFLRQEEGFYPAYHMHRENWITIILDGTVSMETILPLLKESYSLTLKKAVSRKTPERGAGTGSRPRTLPITRLTKRLTKASLTGPSSGSRAPASSPATLSGSMRLPRSPASSAGRSLPRLTYPMSTAMSM